MLEIILCFSITILINKLPKLAFGWQASQENNCHSSQNS